MTTNKIAVRSNIKDLKRVLVVRVVFYLKLQRFLKFKKYNSSNHLSGLRQGKKKWKKMKIGRNLPSGFQILRIGKRFGKS